MANFRINLKSSAVAVTALGLAAALGVATVVYLNHPVFRVSLPPGTEFPACLLEDAPTCQESVKCVGMAPGRLTYIKGHLPVAAFGKNWCCPDGTTAKLVGVPVVTTVVCVVENPTKP